MHIGFFFVKGPKDDQHRPLVLFVTERGSMAGVIKFFSK